MSNEVGTERLYERVDGLNAALNAGDTVSAMRNVNALMSAVSEMATELVRVGVREGMSQASMARALGVSASTLRGAKRDFSRV